MCAPKELLFWSYWEVECLEGRSLAEMSQDDFVKMSRVKDRKVVGTTLKSCLLSRPLVGGGPGIPCPPQLLFLLHLWAQVLTVMGTGSLKFLENLGDIHKSF